MLQDYRDKHKGETCVVIGNGPSLDHTPLLDLARGRVTFGANKIYQYPFDPTYWTCVDENMLHDCIPELYKAAMPSVKFLPRGIPLEGVNFLNVVVESGFSKDAANKVMQGGTVTFVNMQLAYYMGFQTVLLVGVDHHYPKVNNGKPGSRFIATPGDPDHFQSKTGDYFTPGKLYNKPELDNVARAVYPTAKNAFESDGRRIINLTPGTHLDVFEKGEISQWIK